ncbi:MAG TPA: hypothetical protein VML75_04085 [Kofleriaceae bacterium]|nr:hypothetical protein [Kofleriaceae bacterium]
MRHLILALGLLTMFGCSRESGTTKPKGTLADPVEVCERVADVCRFDGAKLGVCTTVGESTELVCMSQH